MAIEMNGFQKKTFYAYERKSYDLKVNTIKNCIFACDIEPSAVDIATIVSFTLNHIPLLEVL